MKISVIENHVSIPSSIVIPIGKNEKLDANLNRIARTYSIDYDLLCSDFKANKKEVLSTYSKKKSGSLRIYLIGLGEMWDYGLAVKYFRSFFNSNYPRLGKDIIVDLCFIANKLHPQISEALSVGAITGSYDLGLYKSDKEKKEVHKLQILSTHPDLSTVIGSAVALAETQTRIMDLVNAPANRLTPQILGEWAKDSGKENGFEVKVMEMDEIKSKGLNALLAVNQGSDLPPRFIIAEYKSQQAKNTVGLVGKGVTFDTGGLSIKGSANMHYMKSDMGGAAAVLGSIELVAKLKLPINIIAIVPATENSVDAKSVKPGDIIHSYEGKTIEVIDTDAEGRLILADALAYMTKNYSTDFLIDYATLTGSVIGTLGFHAAGLLTKNEGLRKDIAKAGTDCGEKVWPLPMWEEYEEDLESDVADIKNYSGKPLAGAITAAKFLEAFTNEHPNWAHIDIAGTAFGDTVFGKQKNATGYGVDLTVSFLRQLIANKKGSK